MSFSVRRLRLLTILAALVTVAIAGATFQSSDRTAAAACPAGYRIESEGTGPVSCVTAKHPEPLIELILRQEGLESVRSAPNDHVAPGAYANALAERKAMSGKTLADTAGAWTQLGKTPLIVNDPNYGSVNGLGLVHNMGRLDNIEYDAAHNRLFVAKGTGGIWMSENLGDSWRSIGDSLPSQVVGAVAWSEANGGTLVVVSGDPSFGSGGYTGYGAFYSSDLGATWQKATGIPDGALGFAIEVDPTNPSEVYAATSFGLFRSADGGRTYSNANLPTGACAGVAGNTTGRPECLVANVVTDVEVRRPGGVNENVSAGTVVAVVGWRAGTRKNSDGTVQSTGNGIYRSTTGEPGSFSRLATTGFAQQDRIGRVEFGPTTGATQDHDFLYAIVQDAAALNGQLDIVDASGVPDPRAGGTVLNGVYVSSDFGQTWTLMADDNAIAKNPATGSALVGYGQATGYEPGIQGWYNLWIAPDPTRQSSAGVPTRLAFGLEEVWQNELTSQPMSGPATFKVIGRYFSGEACMFLPLGLPECPTNRPPTTSTTTHPDQQDGLWIPDGSGGVTLAVGNDGGFYKAHVGAGQELDNGKWGDGNQAGFQTLLPYDVTMANDGTAYAGLQDNGHLKVTPDGSQYVVYGGDGTFAEVEPKNSDIAYEAYVFNEMSVTTDGGRSWKDINPGLTATRFVNPFEMDLTDPRHLLTAGNEVAETTWGPDTEPGTTGEKAWKIVYDLGTANQPGNAGATPSTSDPANSMSAIDVHGDAAYVGFCGVCDILNATAPFKRGIATNVGGTAPPKRGTSDGWHIAAAQGLPNRFITSVAIHPSNIRTIYVTLGGYSRRWVPPGSLQDKNADIGVGHVFKSTDAGATFTDISGNLPDVPATWVTLRNNQVIVGTDVGVFASDLKGKTTYAPLNGLPVVPISTMNLKPNDPNLLVVGAYGRGVWTYRFAKTIPAPPADTPDTPPPAETGATLAGPFGFETGADGWTVTAGGTLGVTTWKRGAPGHSSATSFQVTPYTDESTTTLVSAPVTHPGGWVFVDFRNRRDTEPTFDFLHVEWSTDGTSWTRAKWAWDANANAWSQAKTFDGLNPAYPEFDAEKVAFNAPAGTLQVRFRFSSDQLISSPLYQGVWVDDVRIGR
jgi:hypothetical protein